MNKREKSLLSLAKDRIKSAEEFWGENYEQGEDDVKFLYLDQWDSKIRAQRERQGRPCLTENRLLAHVHQLCNEIRQASPSIVPKPVDSDADVDTAEILGGLIRNIINVSDGDTVFDTASKNAITTGFGWIRVATDYADYDTFDQEIKIERINNPFSVLIDPNSQRLDGSDAEYIFVHDYISKEDFEDMYPDADMTQFNGKDSWSTANDVRITEYFYKEYEKKTLYKTPSGDKYEVFDGETVLAQREVETCKIKYCKLTKGKILEENEFLGRYIPIIPVYGEEIFVEGKRQLFSMIHQAKDPQRMFNYWLTAATEVTALQPKAPWIAPKGSFKTKGKQWMAANVDNPAFLEYDVVYDKNDMPLSPPQRQQPPMGSATMFQETMRAADGIKSVLGMFDASMGQQSPDVSGKAIIARKVQGDNANFHFIDNLSTAMKQVGRVIIGLIPLVYSNQRIVRILGQDDVERLVPINQPYVQDGEDYMPANGQQAQGVFDLKAGKYDVVVEVGASYATKRQEAANAIIEIARVNPAILEVAGDLLVKNLDIPNSQVIAERIRSTMNPALLGDDLEGQRMQQMTQALELLQQKLQETETALQVKTENEQFKNQIELAKVENDRKEIEISAIKTMAEIEKMKAETRDISAETMERMTSIVNGLNERLNDVYDAVDVILTEREEKATGEPESPETQQEETAE